MVHSSISCLVITVALVVAPGNVVQSQSPCFDPTNKFSYMGTVSTTTSGKTCQQWSSQTPQSHTHTAADFPDGTFPSNYCRVPKDASGASTASQPWCYTTDLLTRWEPCNVTLCKDTSPAAPATSLIMSTLMPTSGMPTTGMPTTGDTMPPGTSISFDVLTSGAPAASTSAPAMSTPQPSIQIPTDFPPSTPQPSIAIPTDFPPSTQAPMTSTPQPTVAIPTDFPPSTQAPGTDFPPSTMPPVGTDFPPSTTAAGKTCSNQKADVVFLVDSSGSVGPNNFMKQLDYIINLVGGLNVDSDHIRVGLASFSDDAHLQFNLNQYMDKARLMMALGFVSYQPGATYTDEGLKYVRENMFQPSVGGRPDAQRVVIVLTDGKSTMPDLTKSEARKLRLANGTIVISLGIGSGVDQSELEYIASGTNYTLMAQDFDSLDTTLGTINNLTCDAVTGYNPGADLLVPCETRAVDLAFLLDTSSSEGTTRFNEQLQFAQNFVKSLEVGPTKYQVAAATFGTNTLRQFYLNQYDTTQAVVDAIGRIPYSGGSTYTHKALAFVRDTLFAGGYGRRPGVPKVVIVMTDGQSINKQQTLAEADKLRQDGYIVYGLGIGSGVVMSELSGIASDPSLAFPVTSFADLTAFLPTLQNAYCNNIEEIVPVIPTKDPALEKCGQSPSDVIFVLDASSSEGRANFMKQVYFAGNVTKSLEIGPTNVQIGMMTFSTSPYKIFYLDDYDNKYDTLDAISRTPYQSGATYTDEALKFARETMMSTLHGRRLGAQPVVIVLTDGQSTRPSQTVAEAEALKRTGAVVIAIGIGSGVKESELDAIASDPAHKFNVNSFDFLAAIQQQIVKETCEGSGTTPAPHPECGDKPADLVFVMDASSSEGALNFEKMKSFIADFSGQFIIGKNNVQISCVAFSTRVHVEFPLNGTSSRLELLNKISNIPFYGGTTMTAAALEAVRTQVLTPGNGSRPNAADTVILLTDGRSVVASETKAQADRLKQMGVQVITIGVGSSVDERELEAVATDVQHAFKVINFDALQTIEQELVETACQACATTEPADILLIVDSSSDESAQLFTKEMNFIENLVNTFNVGPNNAQFALMTFADKVNMEFWFNTYQTKQDIEDALQKVVYKQGATNTDLALKFAREYAYLPFHGARAAENQYVIVVTDGTAANITATIEEADKLKAAGKTVMAVGIGKNANKAELEAIATDPSHVFIADDVDALANLHKDITVKTCKTIYDFQNASTTPAFR